MKAKHFIIVTEEDCVIGHDVTAVALRAIDQKEGNSCMLLGPADLIEDLCQDLIFLAEFADSYFNEYGTQPRETEYYNKQFRFILKSLENE